MLARNIELHVQYTVKVVLNTSALIDAPTVFFINIENKTHLPFWQCPFSLNEEKT